MDENSCCVHEALFNPPCFTPGIDFIMVGFTVSSSEILEALHQSSFIANVNISVPRLRSSLCQKPEVVRLSIMAERDIEFRLKSFSGCYSCECLTEVTVHQWPRLKGLLSRGQLICALLHAKTANNHLSSLAFF